MTAYRMTNLSCLFMAASSYFANRQWPLTVTKHVNLLAAYKNLKSVYDMNRCELVKPMKRASGPDGVTVHASSLMWRLEKAVV